MKIAIAGYGIEGEQNYLYYSKDPANDVTIVDQKQQPDKTLPTGAKTILGEDAFEKLSGFDLVIRTASLAPSKLKTDGKIWSATNEFFAKCPAKIIGVTGTKGKGTTASLIASILEAAGKKVWLVGNIGRPALETLEEIKSEDIVVYELSSFQLWDIERSPRVAVVLMIEPDHLDVHVDFDDYILAKANITRYQTGKDILVYNQENKYARAIAANSTASKTPYPAVECAHVEGEIFYWGNKKICSTSALKIIGKHNQENACAAISAIWNITQDIQSIEKGLNSFEGLPHRLELVRAFDGIKYYDDSFASATPATKVAVNSFSQPVILIAGGYDRGLSYDDLAATIAVSPNLKKVLLIGQTKQKIAQSFIKLRFQNYEILEDNLEVAVKRAQQISIAGDVVVLSPGCASFDMFKDFTERGNVFQEVVNKL